MRRKAHRSLALCTLDFADQARSLIGVPRMHDFPRAPLTRPRSVSELSPVTGLSQVVRNIGKLAGVAGSTEDVIVRARTAAVSAQILPPVPWGDGLASPRSSGPHSVLNLSRKYFPSLPQTADQQFPHWSRN